MKTKISRKNQKLLLIVILALATTATAAIYWSRQGNNSQNLPSANTDSSGVAFDTEPATPQQQDEADSIKEDNDKNGSGNQSQTPFTPAQPIITYAGQYGDVIEVGAYINVFESDGQCVLELTKGSQTKTTSVQAVPNVSTTDCPVMTFNRSELTGGEWSATVRYTSRTTNAKSNPQRINVQ